MTIIEQLEERRKQALDKLFNLLFDAYIRAIMDEPPVSGGLKYYLCGDTSKVVEDET